MPLTGNQDGAVAYVALGANLGDRSATLREAVARLGEFGTVEAVSALYETDPVGYLDQPAFLNAAVCLRTPLSAPDLLAALLSIEADLGRVRSFPNAPRSLDLDLLFYDDLILATPNLTLPHPRLPERAFVLVPLAEIAPDLIHPARQRLIAALLTDLGDVTGVRPCGSLVALSPGPWQTSG